MFPKKDHDPKQNAPLSAPPQDSASISDSNRRIREKRLIFLWQRRDRVRENLEEKLEKHWK